MSFEELTYQPYASHARYKTRDVNYAQNASVQQELNYEYLDLYRNENLTLDYDGLQPPIDVRHEVSWLDFSSIANPLGTPGSFTALMKQAIENQEATYVPDFEQFAMRTSLARIFRLKPDNFICGSSVADIIRSIAQAYQPCTVGVICPGRREYNLAASNAGHKVIDLSSPSSFVAPEPDFVRQYDMHFEAAILANPSYPSSRLLPKTTLIQYLETCKWVIIDERSIELSLGGESYIDLVKEYRNLYVVRSLSQSFALPGLPLSYAASCEQNIKQVNRFYDGSCVPMFMEVLAGAVYTESKYLSQARDLLETEIPWMQCMLNLIPGINIFPAEANFVMCEFINDGRLNLAVKNTKELASQLQLAGFIISPIENVPGLSPNRYFCVSVRSRKENERLIQALKRIVNL